jgi:hypothetical protein
MWQEERYLKCGLQEAGSSIMITLLLTQRCQLLKGRRLKAVGDVITKAINDLKAILQTSFEQCFQKWKRRWETCVAVQGDYFERDNIQ